MLVDTSGPKFKKAMAMAKELGLDRDARMELAEYLLRRDIASWTDLEEHQLDRILDAFDGHHYINQLILMSGSGHVVDRRSA